ncbi:MAG: AI-2E family transporter [Treponema sp.]|jgi:predicted PurR-regulated permease PerM|nr:AI-2E family transporter [Treponema sp.]
MNDTPGAPERKSAVFGEARSKPETTGKKPADDRERRRFERRKHELHTPERMIQNMVLGVILVVLLLVVCRLFAPFFTVLLWSVLLYIILSPLHHRFIRKLAFKTRREMLLKNIWAAVFALLTLVLILLPISFVGSLFLRQILDLLRTVRSVFYTRPAIMSDIIESVTDFLREFSSGQIDISADEIWRQIFVSLSSGLQNMISLSSNFVRNVGNFVLGVVLLLFCLFFLFSDGPYLSRLVLHAIPLKQEYLSTLTKKFMEITRNLISGYIMVALIQAVVAYIVFAIFDVKGALVFAALTFIAVFIPMIGGGLVWLPLGIMRLAMGDVTGGILFLAVSGFCISLLDNFLRPMFLKDRIQLHPLIIFFAIFGGIRVFGFNGIILGPMVVILFLTVLDLFLTEHSMSHEEDIDLTEQV